MATNAFNFGPILDQVLTNTTQIVTNTHLILSRQGQQLLLLEKIMSVLDDLNTADAAIQAAVNSAIDLIKSLHTNPGSVTDAEVEAEVAKLQAAASALSAAKPMP